MIHRSELVRQRESSSFGPESLTYSMNPQPEPNTSSYIPWLSLSNIGNPAYKSPPLIRVIFSLDGWGSYKRDPLYYWSVCVFSQFCCLMFCYWLLMCFDALKEQLFQFKIFFLLNHISLTLYHLRSFRDLSKSYLLGALGWLGSACCVRWIDWNCPLNSLLTIDTKTIGTVHGLAVDLENTQGTCRATLGD